MVKGSITIGEVVDYGRRRLGFSIEAGEGGLERILRYAGVECIDLGASFLSFRNLPESVPVVVRGAAPSISSLLLWDELITLIIERHTPLVVFAPTVTGGCPSLFSEYMDTAGTVLATSPEDPPYIASRLTHLLRRRVEGFISLHGVLVDVGGLGVLIRGASGSGKTGCAVELIKRGYRLVADDCVEIRRDKAGVLRGKAPVEIKNLMDIQGLGIVHAGSVFGENAVLEETMLGFCCDIRDRADIMNRSRRAIDSCRLLGRRLPRIRVPSGDAKEAVDRIEEARHEISHVRTVLPR